MVVMAVDRPNKNPCCPISRRGSDGSGISLDGGVPLKIDVNSGEGGGGLGEDDTEDDEREEEGDHDNGPNSGKNNNKNAISGVVNV